MIAIATIRVLIADPNDVLRAVYQEFLSWHGFRVATAADGLECMDRLRSFRPQVLVLEPELPMGGGDGVLALKQEDPEIAQIPVVLVTAAKDEAILERVLDFPIDAVQPKPLVPSLLAHGIRCVLDRRRAARLWARSGDSPN